MRDSSNDESVETSSEQAFLRVNLKAMSRRTATLLGLTLLVLSGPLAAETPASVYTFVWSGAFHPRFTIVIEIFEDSTARATSTFEDESARGKVASLSSSDGVAVVRAFADAHFWELSKDTKAVPLNCRNWELSKGVDCPRIDLGCRDGAVWEITAQAHHGTHSVTQHCNRSKSVESLGQLMFRLSGLQLDHELY